VTEIKRLQGMGVGIFNHPDSAARVYYQYAWFTCVRHGGEIVYTCIG